MHCLLPAQQYIYKNNFYFCMSIFNNQKIHYFFLLHISFFLLQFSICKNIFLTFSKLYLLYETFHYEKHLSVFVKRS